MAAHAAILIVGRDPTLLETRRRVLERAGYPARIALDLAEARKIIETAPVEIALLCHTLPAEDCQEIVAVEHTVRPGICNLILPRRDFIDLAGEHDFVMEEFAAPRALIAAVQQLSSHP